MVERNGTHGVKSPCACFGSFPAGCTALTRWCGPGHTGRQTWTHTHAHTHTRPALTYTSCQTATPPRRESAICLHHVPLQNPLIHSPSSSLFFSHLSVITRDRAWADGSLLNRCFVRQTTHILCRSNSNRPARSCI